MEKEKDPGEKKKKKGKKAAGDATVLSMDLDEYDSEEDSDYAPSDDEEKVRTLPSRLDRGSK